MAERKTNWLQKVSWAGLGIVLAACAKEIQNGQINSTGETPTNQPQITGHKEGEFELNLTPPIIVTPTPETLTPLPVEPTPNPYPLKEELQPTPENQNAEEKIRIEYNDKAEIYNVRVDAQTVAEYIDLRPTAIKKLKDLNIDPCARNVYWPIPPEIKYDFTRDDLLQLHQITCPNLKAPNQP